MIVVFAGLFRNNFPSRGTAGDLIKYICRRTHFNVFDDHTRIDFAGIRIYF